MPFGEGNGTPLQYSCLENPMDRGAPYAAVLGVAASRTGLSGFAFTFHFHALEKAMAAHSSVLAWRIPGTGEPGGLPSMGSHRVGHDWSDLAAAWCLFPFSLFGNHKSILYICEFVSVFLQSFTCLIFQFPHVSDTIQCSSFCVWFILLSIIPSRSVFVVANFIFE